MSNLQCDILGKPSFDLFSLAVIKKSLIFYGDILISIVIKHRCCKVHLGNTFKVILLPDCVVWNWT